MFSIICSDDFYKIGRRVSNAQLRAEREKEAKLKEAKKKEGKKEKTKKNDDKTKKAEEKK